MSTQNTIKVSNQLPNALIQSLDILVTGTSYCDNPTLGQRVIEELQPNTTGCFVFRRMGEHNCDGKQGTFGVEVRCGSGGTLLGAQQFNFDENGQIGPDDGGSFFTYLKHTFKQQADGTYLWTFSN